MSIVGIWYARLDAGSNGIQLSMCYAGSAVRRAADEDECLRQELKHAGQSKTKRARNRPITEKGVSHSSCFFKVPVSSGSEVND